MNILEHLKAAKQLLATDMLDDKLFYICFAVTDANTAKYGVPTINHPRRKDLEEAHDFIEARLKALSEPAGTDRYVFFGDAHAAYVLGIPLEEVDSDKRQSARHLWLDSLIKELENAQSN